MFIPKIALFQIFRWSNNSNKYFKFLTYFVTFFVPVLINSRLDPDVHHDGIMYTAALGAASGLVPNRDVFTQYGFGSPFVQGLWMHFTFDSLFSLRIFTAIQLAIIAQILFWFCKKFLSELLSFLIAFAWVIQLSARIPWSSILVTLFSLLVVLLLFTNSTPETYLTSSKLRLFLSGFIVALSSTFRLQNILLFFAIMIAIVFFEKDRRGIRPYLLGFVTFSVLFFFLGLKFNVLQPMIAQTIIWPIDFYSPPALTKSFIISVLWFPALFITVTIAIASLMICCRNISRANTLKIQIFLTATLTFFSFFVLTQTRDGYLSLKNPKVLLIDGTNKLIGFLGFWSAMACALLFLYVVYRRYFVTSNFSSVETKTTWLIFLGVAALPQLYPLHDQVHLWYVTPTFLIGCIPVLGTFLKRYTYSKGWITSLLIFSILSSSFVDLKDFAKFRIPFSNVAMAGLLGDPALVNPVDSRMKYLEKFATEASVGFDCIHGMYAGANKRFLSNDPMFVNWGLNRKLPMIESSSIFLCNKTKNEIDSYLTSGYIQSRLWNNPDNSFDAFLVRQ